MNKILIVDDDQIQRWILRANLEKESYTILEATNGLEAIEILSEDTDIRILLTDLKMPGINGYDLIKNVRENESKYTYIIVLTSFEDKKSLLKALSFGADDYLVKPVSPDELNLRLKAGARLLKLESQEELLFSMSKLADYRSEETGYHLERSYHYTRLLARYLSKNHPELSFHLNIADEIAKVCPLHDIGKIAIPDHILHKPGPLTKEEFDIMKTHTNIGGKLLKELYDKTNSQYLLYAYEIAMFHHEKWNGKGYPDGLKGLDIPLSARIVALADVYDAISTKRSYKDAAPHEKAKSIILKERGKHFDPMIVDAFISLEDEWIKVRNKFIDKE